MGIIYLARNVVNGKGYVGKTKGSLRARKNAHLKYAQEGKKWTFHVAIRKYGFDAFEWSVLYEDEDDDREWMDWWERKFIRDLSTKVPNGYNMTDGGEGGVHEFTEEQKKKISDALNGREKTEKQRAVSKVFRKGKSYAEIYGPERGAAIAAKIAKSNKGKKRTKEFCEEMRQLHLGRPKSEQHKKNLSKSKRGSKNPNKGKTLEEIYGEEKATLLRAAMKIAATKREQERKRLGLKRKKESKTGRFTKDDQN